jgi:hypothetical protein
MLKECTSSGIILSMSSYDIMNDKAGLLGVIIAVAWNHRNNHIMKAMLNLNTSPDEVKSS